MILTDSDRQTAQIHFALMDVSDCDIIEVENPPIVYKKRAYNEKCDTW